MIARLPINGAKGFLMILSLLCFSLQLRGEIAEPVPVYDIDAARGACDEITLDAIEGIWIYPADDVTVLVRKMKPDSSSQLRKYQIMAIETADCRIAPGDVIGSLESAAEKSKYILTLFSEKKEGIFSHPQKCTATLSKDEDTMILSKEKSKFRVRINFNPNSLLPTLWKSLLRFGVSVGSDGNSNLPSAGMIKIYPSYDGNGSSRRQPRYL